MNERELRTLFYQLRVKKGISREYFMQKYSREEQTVKNWETGKHAPCLKLAYEIWRDLGCWCDFEEIYDLFSIDTPYAVYGDY